MHTLKTIELTKSYRNKKVVDHVSLVVHSGEIVGLLGPNGAGKTTTFYMIVGIIKPDAGDIVIDDQSISPLPIFRRSRLGIQYLPQEPSVFRKLTVAENILAILQTLPLASLTRQTRLDGLLQELKISHLANNKAYSLSGGERRRVEITRALATSPRFVLLDEPFAGIDPLAVNDIQNIIHKLKEKGLGILISDHNVRETLGVCDRAYIMNEGSILEEGTPEKIVDSDLAKKIYLGESFRL
ncbi:LPS export ABC transporter ATP-binding protein [Desulfobacca acetoxidans]|uniref:Sulfate-transporting ATPase n=1 Tax=Desulfobacca acetoxidans (strain ATCC 700848 / DSM 11109 / ASRB2) TaxID=880072 RepID=F2NJY2_DESAR|nr:LPS export ABC transporter ATP-binding protein [Desulfobacca acetoxidans]AEB09926.1 Sulfate-transporting ATPase [Desulfobacca acetoxidans DSM 11109]